MRVLGTLFLSVAVVGLCASASAGDALPETGAAKLSAYLVCHSLAAIDMGSAGSDSATECNGIVKNQDSQKQPDNLSIHCLEHTGARTAGYKYSGACLQTDSDGDALYMTYEGSDSGQIKWIGGTGKYKDVAGSGSLGVQVAPGGLPGAFAYTLNYDVSWSAKAK